MREVSYHYLKNLHVQAAGIVSVLKHSGINVQIVSGGYKDAMQMIAFQLGMPMEKIHANTLYFDEDGNYRGFDKENPLTRKEGKRQLINQLKNEGVIQDPVAIVGDGVSELEAYPAVDMVIGFGGSVVRDRVVKEADVYIKRNEFSVLVPLLIGKHETRRVMRTNSEDSQFGAHMAHALVQRGLAQLQYVRFNANAELLQQELRPFMATSDAFYHLWNMRGWRL